MRTCCCRSTREASCARGTSCATSRRATTSPTSRSAIPASRRRIRGHARSVRGPHTIPRTRSRQGHARFYADAARYLVDRVPYAVAKYRSRAFRARVARLLDERRFDAVVCDFLCRSSTCRERLPCPGILFTHNVEAEIWRRHAENAGNPVSRFCSRSSGERMLRFERDALARFDLVLAVSDADREPSSGSIPDALRTPAHVVQTGVDTTYFAPPASARTARAPGLHRVDGLAAERRRHAVLRAATFCRASARSSPTPRSASSAARRRRR